MDEHQYFLKFSLIVFIAVQAAIGSKSQTLEVDILKELKVLHGEIKQLHRGQESMQQQMDVMKARLMVIDDHSNQPMPDNYYQHTKFGCFGDIITLSCPAPQLINVTHADYGKHSVVCESDCCSPHPTGDCRESVDENQFNDWVALKLLCDNQSSCEYEYTGANIDQCEPDYLADYMQIYFKCQPENTDYNVGFTACKTQSTLYPDNSHVIFEKIISNYGNYYEPTTGTFQCPTSGLYIFNVNINTDLGARMDVEIVKENSALVNAFGDDHSDNERATGTAFVVTECLAGQVIWTRSEGGEGLLYGHETLIRSTFSGFLLRKYI